MRPCTTSELLVPPLVRARPSAAQQRGTWDRVTSLSSHLFEWTSTLGGPPSLRAWSMQLQTESSPPAPTAAATIIDTTADEQ